MSIQQNIDIEVYPMLIHSLPKGNPFLWHILDRIVFNLCTTTISEGIVHNPVYPHLRGIVYIHHFRYFSVDLNISLNTHETPLRGGCVPIKMTYFNLLLLHKMSLKANLRDIRCHIYHLIVNSFLLEELNRKQGFCSKVAYNPCLRPFSEEVKYNLHVTHPFRGSLSLRGCMQPHTTPISEEAACNPHATLSQRQLCATLYNTQAIPIPDGLHATPITDNPV